MANRSLIKQEDIIIDKKTIACQKNDPHFSKIFFSQSTLPDNRIECTHWHFFSACRNNYGECGVANFSIFHMTTLLRNEYKPMKKENLYNMIRGVEFRHGQKMLQLSPGF